MAFGVTGDQGKMISYFPSTSENALTIMNLTIFHRNQSIFNIYPNVSMTCCRGLTPAGN